MTAVWPMPPSYSTRPRPQPPQLRVRPAPSINAAEAALWLCLGSRAHLTPAEHRRPSHSRYSENRHIIITVGLMEPVRAALAASANEIELALIYSSVAKGTATAASR